MKWSRYNFKVIIIKFRDENNLKIKDVFPIIYILPRGHYLTVLSVAHMPMHDQHAKQRVLHALQRCRTRPPNAVACSTLRCLPDHSSPY